MTVTTPLLETIEPDESVQELPRATEQAHSVVVLTPTKQGQVSGPMASTHSDAEAGVAGIFRRSAHPVILFFFLCFRTAAITIYVLRDGDYVLSTVLVVVLLAVDFWNCRNVAGRTLVGLRFWNQVDEDGESYWVFESRDPSQPANPTDAKVFWVSLYTFPLLWLALLFVALIKINFRFIPIVVLALIFNVTCVVGYTYADRDAKQRWADGISTGWNMGMGWIGGQVLGGVKKSVGRVFT